MADRISIPQQSVPIMDPKTGLIDPVWYDVLRRIVDKLNTL